MGRTAPTAFAAVGEISLSGQVRPCSHLEQRIAAAARRGVRSLLVPKAQAAGRNSSRIELIPIDRVGQALEFLAVAGPAKPTAKQKTLKQSTD
jgi:DNA repair protein RadA/Sms